MSQFSGSSIRIACQTYTWEMLGDGWKGRVDDLLGCIEDAGYAGIEITNNMIRECRAFLHSIGY